MVTGPTHGDVDDSRQAGLEEVATAFSGGICEPAQSVPIPGQGHPQKGGGGRGQKQASCTEVKACPCDATLRSAGQGQGRSIQEQVVGAGLCGHEGGL